MVVPVATRWCFRLAILDRLKAIQLAPVEQWGRLAPALVAVLVALVGLAHSVGRPLLSRLLTAAAVGKAAATPVMQPAVAVLVWLALVVVVLAVLQVALVQMVVRQDRTMLPVLPMPVWAVLVAVPHPAAEMPRLVGNLLSAPPVEEPVEVKQRRRLITWAQRAALLVRLRLLPPVERRLPLAQMDSLACSVNAARAVVVVALRQRQQVRGALVVFLAVVVVVVARR